MHILRKKILIQSNNKIYSILISKFLTFLRDLVKDKYDLKKYIIDNTDPRNNKVSIPFSDIKDILKKDYDYEMTELKWNLLFLTSNFLSELVLGINGVSMGGGKLSFFNSANFGLNAKGHDFLNDVFFTEKFQNIKNDIGRNRTVQLYDDLNVWVLKERWVDIAINMGVIIEYCLDNYIEVKNFEEFYEKKAS